MSEFAKSGVIFDFEDSSAQAEAAKKLGKYVQDNGIQGISGKTNSDGEVMYRDLEKGVYLFVQTQKTQIGNQVYQSEPFIITVPGNYDGQIIWNVTAELNLKMNRYHQLPRIRHQFQKNHQVIIAVILQM